MTELHVDARWPVRPLADIVDPRRPITYGIVLPGPEQDDGVPYVRVVDMRDGGVLAAQLRRTTREIAASYRRSELKSGDVLLSIRGHVGRVAIVPDGLDGANLTQDTARLAIVGCDPGYVAWALRSGAAKRWMELRTKGVAVRGINLSDVRELPVPVPPVDEQRRIAAILDEADGLRRKWREALGLLDELLRSAFLEMFGDPVTNPRGWETVALGDASEFLQYGTSTKCSDEPLPGSLPVLRIPNVVAGDLDWGGLKYATLPAREVESLRLRAGDLLFVRSNGNPDYIARCAVVPDRCPPALFASYIIRARLRSKSLLLPVFVQAVISNPSYRSKIEREAKTTAGNYNISADGLRSLIIPRPPLCDQQRYGALVAEVASECHARRTGLAECENLFESLLHCAFTGEPGWATCLIPFATLRGRPRAQGGAPSSAASFDTWRPPVSWCVL